MNNKKHSEPNSIKEDVPEITSMDALERIRSNRKNGLCIVCDKPYKPDEKVTSYYDGICNTCIDKRHNMRASKRRLNPNVSFLQCKICKSSFYVKQIHEKNSEVCLICRRKAQPNLNAFCPKCGILHFANVRGKNYKLTSDRCEGLKPLYQVDCYKCL